MPVLCGVGWWGGGVMEGNKSSPVQPPHARTAGPCITQHAAQHATRTLAHDELPGVVLHHLGEDHVGVALRHGLELRGGHAAGPAPRGGEVDDGELPAPDLSQCWWNDGALVGRSGAGGRGLDAIRVDSFESSRFKGGHGCDLTACLPRTTCRSSAPDVISCTMLCFACWVCCLWVCRVYGGGVW